ncbi:MULTISPECIES: thioesterase family protein [Caulobacter]|jgi:acyl-CoA thioesterase|uniref:Acyl-CoA thioesterase n=1 Tax=Caulobacter vibrioides OR37 TaxID=1292034 RepID=R0CY50_CAUVI|nr:MULTISPECIES: thioesterase family protein [Caulobacter]ENZ81210.1 acyl-CoA thioesterase [Caulobacter vibrioides OR37]MBQ1562532.1 thioesterase family protein [Caulobacter sp.]
MTAYTDLIAAVSQTETGFSAFVTDDWKQGRTTYGGLSAALCVEAALKTFPDAPPLRSAQFAFVGPAAGELAISVKPLRQGKSTLFVAVDLLGEQGVATHGVLTFGAARASVLSYGEVPAPAVAAPEDCELFFPENRQGAPHFSAQFEVRKAGGTRPLGGGEPEYLLWIRHRDAAANSLSALVALADMPPPPAMALFPQPAPISTMTWALDITGLPGPDDDGWRLLRSTAETIGEGYSTQVMHLWDRQGRPLVLARQNVAVFA